MKKDKLIGVVIPVYNVEKYIKQCLDNILKQTYKNYVVVLVDDGSTDSSVDIIDEYLKKDQRFILIKKDNGGLSSALNAGINYFTQVEENIPNIDYLIFLDSDDYWHEDCLNICVENMQGVQAVWFDYEYIFDGIKPYNHNYTRMDYLGYKKEQIITPMDFFKRVFIAREWHAFAKMGMLDFNFFKNIKLEFKEGLFLEDHLFGVIFFAQATKIKVLPRKLYNYRIRANSLCNYNKNKNNDFMPIYFHRKYSDIMYNQKEYDELGSKLTIALELEKFFSNYSNKKISFLVKNFLVEHYFQESSKLLTFTKDPLNYKSILLNTPYLSAKKIVKESLEYRVGYACKNIKSFFKCFKLLKYGNFKFDFNLENCKDYQESLQLKNHLSFILGSNLVKMYKKIGKLSVLMYPLILIYSYYKFLFKKKYSIENNDNMSLFSNLDVFLEESEMVVSKYMHQYPNAICLDLNAKNGLLVEALKDYKIKIYAYEYNEYFYLNLVRKYFSYNNIFLSNELVINLDVSLESLDYTINNNGYGNYIEGDFVENKKYLLLENILEKHNNIFILSIYLDFYNYQMLYQIFNNEKKIFYVLCFVDKFFKESEEFKQIYNQFKHKNIFFIDYDKEKGNIKK